MSDAAARPERQTLTVSELTRRIKSVIEQSVDRVWVEGEISNFKLHNGNWYFSLKDRRASIRGVMFKTKNRLVKFEVTNGMEVVALGGVSVYEQRGEYQIYVERLEPVGLGALQMKFEQVKAKLESEGLFARDRKKPLPFLPSRVGIVTSKTGAAIQDMLTVLHRRRPHLSILLAPVRVQGKGAATEVAGAVRQLNEEGSVDVIIVGRGGGSLEDLWAFNEEIVARSIAASRIPVVSAVGHETDFTIADFVSDKRAPTPSAAAEIVIRVPEAELREKVSALRLRLTAAERRVRERRLERVENLQKRLKDPRRIVQDFHLRIDDLTSRMINHQQRRVGQARVRFSSAGAKLDSLSPLAVLSRGYAIVRDPQTDRVIRAAHEVAAGQSLRVRLGEGEIDVEAASPRANRKPKKKKSDDDGSQGSLPL